MFVPASPLRRLFFCSIRLTRGGGIEEQVHGGKPEARLWVIGRRTKTNKDMETKKKILSFLLMCLWALGAVGGFCSALYCGAWPCAVGAVVVAWMSWPKLTDLVKNLTE